MLVDVSPERRDTFSLGLPCFDVGTHRSGEEIRGDGEGVVQVPEVGLCSGLRFLGRLLQRGAVACR